MKIKNFLNKYKGWFWLFALPVLVPIISGLLVKCVIKLFMLGYNVF